MDNKDFVKTGDKKLIPIEKERIIELYKTGISYAAIGRAMDPPRHHVTISFWIERLGLKRTTKTITCEYCGKPKIVPTCESRKFCSLECSYASRKNYSLKKEEVEAGIRCEKCGREIPKYVDEQGKKCFKCFWENRKIISTLTKKF